MSKIKLVFLTGTRADYGKMKSLMQACDAEIEFDSYVYVTGMHLFPEYGFTCDAVLADGYKNTHVDNSIKQSKRMDENLAYTILSFSEFVKKIKPDLIIVHGDRVEPLAGAIVGVLNNIKVGHIEGGEVTGTADEFMRHAISKLSSLHFVANDESKYRLIQLGESADSVYVIGSPDIDIMLSQSLPAIKTTKAKHGIGFSDYAIFIYHSVTTSTNLEQEIAQVVSAVIDSGKNYIVVHPNNDHGSDIIMNALRKLRDKNEFIFFESIPFEDFLILLRHCEFIIGNSSAGIREACVYGIPAIDIGARQNKRYVPDALKNIQHSLEIKENILYCISQIEKYRFTSEYFGNGRSADLFVNQIKNAKLFESSLQKTFIELNVTSEAIRNYINEVCF